MDAAGKSGSQNVNFEKLVILDAKDLNQTDFACVVSKDLSTVDLDITYSPENKTLTLQSSPENSFKFSDFRQINFGSSEEKDLNLCSKNTFHYTLKDGTKLDLT